jgi:holo-[acyl-carrier protein] synthase
VTVGIDLLEIERLERALARRPRLEARLFTPAERAYAAARVRPTQHLAARFCAKEAVAKALRLEAWRWRDMEVGPEGRLELHGAVARRAREAGGEVHVSLTHSRTMAAAVALLSPPGPGPRR